MIDLRVTGCETPDQSREEIARLLNEYGVGAVCLLRNGWVGCVEHALDLDEYLYPYDLGENFPTAHTAEGQHLDGGEGEENLDIIRVFPPATRLRVTVEVVE